MDGSTASWIHENLPEIQAIARLKDEVFTQNNQADALRASIETPALLDMAIGYLATSQQRSHDNLQAALAQVPYEELLHRYDSALRWGAGLALRMEQATVGNPEGAIKIRNEAEIVKEYIPALVEQLEAVTEAEIERLREHELHDIAGEQVAAQKVLARMEEIFQTVGYSPIPLLLTPEQRMARAGDASTGYDVVDLFPTDKQTTERQEQIVGRLRRRYTDHLPGASEFLALILAEQPRETWTLDSLGRFIYGEAPEEEPLKYASRASALISNYEKADKKTRVLIIGKVLAEHGLTFQRGRRIRVDRASGKTLGQAVVIFRAVPNEDADRAERIVRTDNGNEYVDTDWQTVAL